MRKTSPKAAERKGNNRINTSCITVGEKKSQFSGQRTLSHSFAIHKQRIHKKIVREHACSTNNKSFINTVDSFFAQ